MPPAKECAKTSGYTPDEIAKLLKRHASHPVKGLWRKNRVIKELEFFDCEVVWRSASEARDCNNDKIPPLTFKMAVPRGMKNIVTKLQSIHGRNAASLPRAVSEHFSVTTNSRMKDIDLKVDIRFSGKFLIFFII